MHITKIDKGDNAHFLNPILEKVKKIGSHVFRILSEYNTLLDHSM